MISPHFKRPEFACRCGCGFDTVDAALLAVLEDLRRHFDRPVIITGPCRCPEHNRACGGAKQSRHLWGQAADIRVDGISAEAVADYLTYQYPNKYGVGRYDGRTHIDVRAKKARWDKRTKKG